MKKPYDEVIDQHYKGVAEECGLSSKSTMADDITRKMETEAILGFVGEILTRHQSATSFKPLTIMDVGCGNGYTLSELFRVFPDQNFVGIEKSDDLRALAMSRVEGKNNVHIMPGDIRDEKFWGEVQADIIICQRVLINLLDREDQHRALHNIIAAAKPSNHESDGGYLLFVESFSSSLDRLNEARNEFDLPPIPPAHHNLYLDDDFFRTPQLLPFVSDRWLTPPNFLSTHYYVTRVLHAAITSAGKPFKRNSEFVSFMSRALQQNVGDYSPLRLHVFQKQL